MATERFMLHNHYQTISLAWVTILSHVQIPERAGGQARHFADSGTDCSASTFGQPIQELARLAHRRSSLSVDLQESDLETDSELEDDASTVSLASRLQTPERQWCQNRHHA